MTFTLALVPLDERPVNTRYPQMLGAIGGADVLLPPPAIRGRQRDPADLPAVAAWLREAAWRSRRRRSSRRTSSATATSSARASRATAPPTCWPGCACSRRSTAGCPVHAFSLITRVPHADDCVEEPGYWCQWGTTFSRYARLWHRAERGAGGRRGGGTGAAGGRAAGGPEGGLADAAAAQPHRHPGTAGHGRARAARVPAHHLRRHRALRLPQPRAGLAGRLARTGRPGAGGPRDDAPRRGRGRIGAGGPAPQPAVRDGAARLGRVRRARGRGAGRAL